MGGAGVVVVVTSSRMFKIVVTVVSCSKICY